jgi:para-aminobenzoate synthetase component 1
LPYLAQVERRFECLADRPWAVWLDSGYPHFLQGRFDIVAADPSERLVTIDGETRIDGRDGADPEVSYDNPLDLLRRRLGERVRAGTPGSTVTADHRHFGGGAIGYFGYELGRRLGGLPVRPATDAWPEMAVGIYDWACVTDHLTRRSWLVESHRRPLSHTHRKELIECLNAVVESPIGRRSAQAFNALGDIQCNLEIESYTRAFERIMRYIRDGDCYQVNLARRFHARVDGDPWLAYRAMRTANPAPFGAYLNYPFGQVLSASPELFLRLSDGRVSTKPIKGTRPRSDGRVEDEALQEDLRGSEKDQAENLMIVDLLRNDLGKTCRVGSVRVPELFAVESFATVHHLVSTVEGVLAEGEDALSLLAGCFPGGSITGAPKHRAMQIIEELEPSRREVYCGSIGWIGFDGNMDTSIAIRTLLHRDGRLDYWAGGGLVADSRVDAELRETLDKATAFFRLLGLETPATG